MTPRPQASSQAIARFIMNADMQASNDCFVETEAKLFSPINRVRYFRGRVSYFDQSGPGKHRFLASDWLKYETLPRNCRTL